METNNKGQRGGVEPSTRRDLRILALAEYWSRDRALPLPEGIELDALIREVERALVTAEQTLDPAGSARVTAFLRLFARRHALAMPEPEALALDLEIMGRWPADLFERAARGVWEEFTDRRLPAAGDLRRHIASELAERVRERNRLYDFALSLRHRRRLSGTPLPPVPRPGPAKLADTPPARRPRRRLHSTTAPERQLLLFA